MGNRTLYLTHLKKFLLRALVVLLGKFAWGDVIEVLQPLEV
jgi:hypothetical protein